jgi:hypothetical protein
MVLEQDRGEPLQAPEDRVMDHHRPDSVALLIDVLSVEALWQNEVELESAALPLTPVAVAQQEFQLRAIEGAFAWLD